MFRVKVLLKSASALSIARRFEEKPNLQGKQQGEYEMENWQRKLHVTSDGKVYIPANMFKNSLVNGVRISAEKIPGKGNNTYTSRFESGVIVEDDLSLDITVDDVGYEDIFVSSDGKKGGSSPQVLKRFPKIDNWEGWVTFTVILDEIITKKVFERFLGLSGQIAGIGRFRPERGGNKGRYTVEKIEYIEEE